MSRVTVAECDQALRRISAVRAGLSPATFYRQVDRVLDARLAAAEVDALEAEYARELAGVL
jgi:hypothetical protein